MLDFLESTKNRSLNELNVVISLLNYKNMNLLFKFNADNHRKDLTQTLVMMYFRSALWCA